MNKQVEQLRAEIERLKKENNGSPLSVCNDLLSFIDSMPDEPKFKVGDTLKKKGKDYTFIVDRIQGGFYHCDHGHGAFFPIEEQDKWELLEEPVSEDLEEATKEWSENEDNVRGCDYISLVRVEEAFKAGANWQKDKLIKDAIEGYVDQVEYPGSTWIELSDTPKDLKDGDNVKLTIIKEDKV
jgi:hypothetical protein